MSDPEYAQLLALQQADLGSFLSGGSAEIGQQLINFGFVPEGLNLGDFSLDPSVRGLAEQNTAAGLSVRARMQRGIDNDLAARGMLSSGEKGFQESSQYSTALRELLDYLAGWQRALTELRSGQAREQMAGAEDARADVMELYPASGEASGGASSSSSAVPEWMRRLARGESLGPAGRRLRAEWEAANPGKSWRDWIRRYG